VLRFQISSQTAVSQTASGTSGICYRFFRAGSSYMVAVCVMFGQQKLTSSVHVLDNSLKLVASATAGGWIQDVAYTVAVGSAPAMLHIVTTEDQFGGRLLSVGTLAFPDLRQVWAQTWSEPEKIVRGSAIFVQANDATVLVRMSPEKQDVLCRTQKPRAPERVLPVPRTARKVYHVYPLRSGAGVHYILDTAWFANGRIRKQLVLSPDLIAAVKG
jgi:hypothetical protein